MEWLSHSQKKYCELCKTSFRFTKLYHPGMPSRIPTSVFIRRAAVHIFNMFVTWCRAVMVVSVWLILLPWCMRVVWRSLFWVGDGGFTRDVYSEPVENAQQAPQPPSFDLEAVRSAVESAKAANTTFPLPLPSLMRPFSQTLNMSAGEPTVWTLIAQFFLGYSWPIPPSPMVSGMNKTDVNATTDHLGPRSPSLLSDISFFNWFPSQAANRFLIDVLEGQIITLVVVVAFILIFLIREWVVQQQPVINMVALGDDAAANRAEPEAQQHDQDLEEEEPRDEDEGVRVYDNDHHEDSVAEDEEDETPTRPVVRNHRSSSARRRRQAIFRTWQDSDEISEELKRAMREGSAEDVARIIEQMPLEDSEKLKAQLLDLSKQMGATETERDVSVHTTPPGVTEEAAGSSSSAFPERSSSLAHRIESAHNTIAPSKTNIAESSSPSHRPHMPARDRSFIATEIQRSMEEGNSWSFANVPDASQGDPQKSQEEHVPDSWEDEEAGHVQGSKDSEHGVTDQEQGSDHSSESWQQVPDIVVDEGVEQEHTSNKGKGKVIDESSDGSPAGVLTPPETMDELLEPASAREVDAASNESACGSDSYREESELDDLPTSTDSEPPSEQAEEQEPEPAPAVRPPPRLLDRILDWIFGDVAPGAQTAEDATNDEHVVQDLADEAPFVPFAANEPREPADPPIQDPEVAAAAAQAGIDLNDQDAIDDAEDLEGIMELIGMQGPLTGLFQNAMFSAVLISATLACAVWLPYLWGKVVILFMGSPISLFVKLPLQLVAASADLVVDGALFLAAGVVLCALQSVLLLIRVITLGTLTKLAERPIGLVVGPVRSISQNAADRLGTLVKQSPLLPRPNYFRLSINSHAALRTIQNSTSYTLNQTGTMVASFYEDVTGESPSDVALRALRQVPVSLHAAADLAYNKTTSLLSWLSTTKSYKITFDLDLGGNASDASSAMEQWSATDRLIAVFAGYAFFAVAGAIYLKRGAPLSTSQQGQKIERIVADILQQAGGVLKVILIISIEMLIFPLYCGLLLDLALLPLFKDASLYTRWQFTMESPWISGFVHWFIGTCYMFHFALFVSLCRKIMRRGVLYFIRDPDDPTFHPVRDVLERSVTTQLRKIAFSALVYGALVIVCLGGVVWGLNHLTTGVLPIHWVSHAPSLEFPLDLLFYNFLTPVIIKLYKPSDGLHVTSQWWFRRCARWLRLSDFLFGEKIKEEEGRKVGGRIVFNGKYVRAPASDQVRIPKGEPVFVEVDEHNARKDGKSEEGGVHNSDMVTMVYIPPWFRVRIAVFVFTIWIFAAVAGISVTIIPLLFGRYLFSLFLPSRIEMNDIHAFSLGVYSLGTVAYSIYQLYKFVRSLHRPVPSPLTTLYTVAATTSRMALRVIRFTYVWTSLIMVIPFLFAVLIELYFLMPLHAYLGPSEPHVVHIIQDWTLGFLYARLAARIIFADRASRAARAFSAVVTNGYLNPNARIATRCFLMPVVAVFAAAIIFPSCFALIMNKTVYYAADEATKSQVWRFSYPAVGLSLIAMWTSKEGLEVLRRWRMVVRDEVYLIGERLHNFGERRAPPAPAQTNAVRA